MTQAVGVALMNQALGWPTVAGKAAVSSGPSPVPSPTDTTSSATLAAGLIDLRARKSDPLGAAGDLPPSTLVPSLVDALDAARVTDFTSARARNLAPPHLPLPAVGIGDMDRAASAGGSAAMFSAGAILPTPVPEPNGFLVLGLAAAAYVLRRQF